MEAVLITVYLIIVVAMIAVILLQRSEGGGLGMGTAGSNGLVSVRGSANLLTRTTAILATLFMATAIGLTVVSDLDRGTESILQRAADGIGEGAEAPTTVLDALNAMQPDTGLAIPQSAPPVEEPVTAPGADTGLAVPAVDVPAAPEEVEATPPAAEEGQPAPGGAQQTPGN